MSQEPAVNNAMIAFIVLSGAVAFLTNIAAGAVGVLVFLVALNGYQESDATFGSAAYLILSVAATLLATVTAVLFVRALLSRGFNRTVSVLLSTAIVLVIALIYTGLFVLAGIGVAEFARVNY